MNDFRACVRALVPALLLGAACVASPAAATADAPARSVVVASRPGPSFLESLALGPDGAIYATDFHGRQVLRWNGAGPFETVLTLPVHPWGLAFDADGTMVFGAGEVGIVDTRAPRVDLVYRQRPGAAPEPLLRIAGARALNGMTFVASGRLVIADGRGGVLWQVDVARGSASEYARHPLLDMPEGFAPSTPAANGLKVHEGYLYVSNTARQQMLRLRLAPDGRPNGEPEVFADQVRVDDFAFSPSGRLVYATHRDRVMAIDADRISRAIEGTGTEVAGSTAVVWRRGGDGPYVATDGGFILHHWYGGPAPSPSNLVRLSGVD